MHLFKIYKGLNVYRGEREKVMAVTIKDVAQLANVAPSTVSRVIANNPRISEKTKVRVREAMEKLGYHPNFIARSLANQSTQILGLVLPSSSETFFNSPTFATILRGLSECARERKYSLLMNTGNSDEEIFEGVVEMVQGGMVDGIVLMYSRMNDHTITYLQSRNFPFVLIGKPYEFAEEITYVDNDNYLAAKEATNYLLELGHKKVGFIGGHSKLVMTHERLLGYEGALKEHGIVPRNDYIFYEEALREEMQEVMQNLLALSEVPTALIVHDDLMALSIMNSLRSLGCFTPEHMSIVSLNNTLFSEISLSSFTSIDTNMYDIGYQATRCLVQKLASPEERIQGAIIPHHFVERDSCQRVQTAVLV